MAQPLCNLGLVYEQVGKYENAITYYSMALGRSPNDEEIFGNLVRTRMLSGDKSGDLKDMVSELAPTHPQPSWQRWVRNQVELEKFDIEGKNLILIS